MLHLIEKLGLFCFIDCTMYPAHRQTHQIPTNTPFYFTELVYYQQKFYRNFQLLIPSEILIVLQHI